MNIKVLKYVGPFLIALGVTGYLTPESIPYLSTPAWLNLLHINLGLLSLIFLIWHNRTAALCYNSLLGLLFLGQGLIAWLELIPQNVSTLKFSNQLIAVNLGLILLFMVSLEVSSQSSNTAQK